MSKSRFRRGATASLLPIAVVLGAACSGPDVDRAGGDGLTEPQVLTMAQPNGAPPDQLAAWADEVDRRSDGLITIEFSNAWRIGEVEYEAGTIDDLRGGEIDLAWVGARVFDTVGVDSFRPLLAPLLVDSHDLQGAVFEAGIPQEMLAGLDEIDLVGVGVLPGPLFRVLGVDAALTGPDDFAGATIGIQHSAQAAETLAALDATARAVPSEADLAGLDGYAQQLSSVAGNHYSETAGFVTTNVNLWPRPLVIAMGAETADRIGADGVAILRDAAQAAVPGALEASRAEDLDAVAPLCAEGMDLVLASDADLSALRAAVEPVHAALRDDPDTAAHLEAIEALAADAPGPDTAACDSSGGPATALDGTYTSHREPADWESCPEARTGGGLPPAHDLELVLDGGTVRQLSVFDGEREIGFSGTYEVLRDRIELTDPEGTVTARWRLEDDTLVLTEVGPGCMDEVVWGAHPWTRAGDEPAQAAGLPDGTYEMTLTAADPVASQCGGLIPEGDETLFVMTLSSGTLEMYVELGGRGGERDHGTEGTYTVLRDRIEIHDRGVGLLTGHWSFSDGQLRISDVTGGECGDRAIYTTHPWTLVSD